MSLLKESNLDKYRISHYQDNKLYINSQLITGSLVFTRELIITPWYDYENCGLSAAEQILTLQPEVIIIGLANPLNPLPQSFIEPLINKQIGFEIMNLKAWVNTMIILNQDWRKVVGIYWPL